MTRRQGAPGWVGGGPGCAVTPCLPARALSPQQAQPGPSDTLPSGRGHGLGSLSQPPGSLVWALLNHSGRCPWNNGKPAVFGFTETREERRTETQRDRDTESQSQRLKTESERQSQLGGGGAGRPLGLGGSPGRGQVREAPLLPKAAPHCLLKPPGGPLLRGPPRLGMSEWGPGGRRGLDLSLPGSGTRVWPAQLPKGLRRWAWLGPCQAGVLPLPTTLLPRGAGGVPPRHTLSLPQHPCSGLSAPAQTPPQLPLGPLAGLSPHGCPGGSQESGPPGAMLPARSAAQSWALVRVKAIKGEGFLSPPSGAHCSHRLGEASGPQTLGSAAGWGSVLFRHFRFRVYFQSI